MIGDMRLKTQLKEHMRRQGVSASQLARAAGVPKQSISDWLAGAPPRNIARVKRVASALGLSLDQLCFGGDPPATGTTPATIFAQERLGTKEAEILKPLSQLFSFSDDGSIYGVVELRLRRPQR